MLFFLYTICWMFYKNRFIFLGLILKYIILLGYKYSWSSIILIFFFKSLLPFKHQGNVVLSIFASDICIRLSSSFLLCPFMFLSQTINPILPSDTGPVTSKFSFHLPFKNLLSFAFFSHSSLHSHTISVDVCLLN